ncbi:hypothetical protein CAC42_7196 [Sphaceloma murrayae]|uniref:Monooxygenase n=1 Tax=Sphaceloma murrayae TaxID=2082308 RepID=A0A2K1QQ39_9PEZI|nr:hypothetical protein CAC42_7196 [Sphaceloma murrayae]
MTDFQPLFKTTDKPRWLKPSAQSLIRAQFNIETWVLLGAALQSLLTLLLPIRLALLPAAAFLLSKIASTYATKHNLLRNPHMSNVIHGKHSAQFPSSVGEFGSAPARSPVCVFMIGARGNSPLGILDPNFKQVGDFFTRMVKELEASPHDTGFLGASLWLGTERASNAANMTIMYFRSAADVHAYAHGPVHREAWDWWYKNLDQLKEVGIYHELYEVPSGNYESIYDQFPPMLAGATQHRVDKEGLEGKTEEWQSPIVDARKGPLRSSKGRMARSTGGDNVKYGTEAEGDVFVERKDLV